MTETPEDILDSIIDGLSVPSLSMSFTEGQEFQLDRLFGADNSSLENYLVFFGGYRSYLETQVSYYESLLALKKAEADEEMTKASHGVVAKADRRRTKEDVRGEVMTTDSVVVQKLREKAMLEATLARVIGLRNAYKAAYETVSRVVALRIQSKEEV